MAVGCSGHRRHVGQERGRRLGRAAAAAAAASTVAFAVSSSRCCSAARGACPPPPLPSPRIAATVEDPSTSAPQAPLRHLATAGLGRRNSTRSLVDRPLGSKTRAQVRGEPRRGSSSSLVRRGRSRAVFAAGLRALAPAEATRESIAGKKKDFLRASSRPTKPLGFLAASTVERDPARPEAHRPPSPPPRRRRRRTRPSRRTQSDPLRCRRRATRRRRRVLLPLLPAASP